MSGGYVAQSNSALTTLTLPALESMSGGYVAQSNSALTTLTLPALKSFANKNDHAPAYGNQTSLKRIELPLLESGGGSYRNAIVASGSYSSLEEIALGAPTTGGTIVCSSNVSVANIAKCVVTVQAGFRASLNFSGIQTAMTAEKIMDILNNLADNTEYATLNIVMGSVNLAKLTDEQKQVATDKNYTLS